MYHFLLEFPVLADACSGPDEALSTTTQLIQVKFGSRRITMLTAGAASLRICTDPRGQERASFGLFRDDLVTL